MKRRMKKILAVMMALTMFGGTAACGGSSQTEPSSSADSSAQESSVQDSSAQESSASGEAVDPYGKVSEAIELHVGRSEDTTVTYMEGQNSSDNYVLNYISEQLGITYVYDFSTPSPSNEYETKVGMVIASGEFPDVMTVNESQMRQLVAAGAVEDMTEAYEKYGSENLKAAYGTTHGISLNSATFEGRLMAMPNISPGADGIPLLFVRADWLEELNLEEPETMEDIIQIANAFKSEKGATDGLVVSSQIAKRTGNNMFGIDALFAAYGAYPKHFIEDAEGNIVYGSNTPEAKTALAEIRKLVESGVIDSSFVVRDATTCEELVTSGKAGMFFGAWWNANSALPDMIVADPSVEWNCYLAPVTEEGIYNTAMISPSSTYLVVKAGSSEAVKEAVIKTMNYQFDIDQETAVSLKADPQDSYSWTMMPFSLLLSRYDDKEVKAMAALEVIEGKASAEDLVPEALRWYNEYQDIVNGTAEDLKTSLRGYNNIRTAGLIGRSASSMNQVFDVSYSQTETMDSKWATLEKLEDEMFLKILTGEESVDAFDGYVEQWNALGGADIIEELKAIAQ